MPRAPLPRRRINQSPKSRVANNNSSSPRLQLAQKLKNKRLGERLNLNDSDDSDRLVTAHNTLRGRRNPPRSEIHGSGAVAQGDTPGSYPTAVQRRRNLTQATKQIVAQSRSRSREATAESNGSTDKPDPQAKVPQARRSGTHGATGDPVDVQHASSPANATPQRSSQRQQPSAVPDESILSGMKPRKRQHSILADIVNNDSSSIGPDDEEAFLPNDESTPMHLTTTDALPSTPGTSISQGSATGKRKLGSDTPVVPGPSGATTENRQTTSPFVQVPSSPQPPAPEPELPPQPSSISKKSKRKAQANIYDDDVMAPPASSSDIELSPARDNRSPPRVTKKRSLQSQAPSTEQLQSLMPTKRRQALRDKKPMNQFDIMDDSDELALDRSDSPEEDVSTFMPSKRGGKGRRQKEPLRKPTSSRTKSTAAASRPSRKATTTSTNYLISTPLSRSTRNHSTKSPSQRTSTVNASATKGLGRRSYGGSRQRTSLSDKENREVKTPEPEVGRGTFSENVTDGGGQEKSSNMWAEIDAWDMDFEEVSVMTGSSSPLAR